MKAELNDGHVHEVLDRLHVITDMLYRHVQQHPLVEEMFKDDNTVLPDMIDEAIDILAEAYQVVGSIDVNKLKQDG